MSDAAARLVLAQLSGAYLPWSTGAMRPAALVSVLNDVWFRRPELIVELGGGVSTILITRLLRELGSGRLLTVEHDPAWAQQMQHQLDREGLAGHAQIVLAPLRPHERAWGAHWYDEDALVAAVDGTSIDVLIVDGPPAWQPGFEHARYPAVGALANWLATGATIVLDDIERAGEQAVLQRWQEEHGLVFDIRPDEGVGVARWAGA